MKAVPSVQELRYVGVFKGNADDRGTRLAVATPGGKIRDVPMERGQLLDIIKGAADALQWLDQIEADR